MLPLNTTLNGMYNTFTIKKYLIHENVKGLGGRSLPVANDITELIAGDTFLQTEEPWPEARQARKLHVKEDIDEVWHDDDGAKRG